jgi:hypothetical protein
VQPAKTHPALAVDARKFLLGNVILYLFRKYPVVANDVFAGSVPTAS